MGSEVVIRDRELPPNFSEDIRGVSLIPGNQAGIFEIRCGRDIIWERGKKNGMPQIKDLKRKVRDLVAPDKDLGHIDNK